MKLKKLRKWTKIGLVAVVVVVLSTKAILAQETSDYLDSEIIINAGAIGAVVGVIFRVFLKWKEKERQLGERLPFNRRYGYIGILNIVIELLPTVIVPALALGSLFATGDPVTDFLNGLARGALLNELATIVLKHVMPEG